MKTIISCIVRKLAENLNKVSVESLTEEDVRRLNEDSSKLLKKIKDNIDKKSKNPLKYLSIEDEILLLSFVVYKRQNIATDPTENPNIEDSAMILHGKVYKLTGDEKKDKSIKEDIEKDLIKQLSKAGLNIK
jgi:hypothetical protein